MSQDAASLSLQPKQVTATSDENEVSGQVQVYGRLTAVAEEEANIAKVITGSDLSSHQTASLTFRLVVCLLCTCLMVVYPLLLASTKVNGKFRYHPSSAVLLNELIKLVFTLVMIVIIRPGFEGLNRRSVVVLAIPSVVYMVGNNMNYLALEYASPVSVNMIGNVRLLMVAIVYRLLLGRPISLIRWVSISALLVAIIFSQLTSNFQFAVTLMGVVIIFAKSFLSVVIGVYTELVLKHHVSNFHVQNLQLYSWGVFANLAMFLYNNDKPLVQFFSTFVEGFTQLVPIAISVGALTGICIGAVMKHLDNIAKFFCVSIANVLLGFGTAYLMPAEFQISLLFLVAAIVIGVCSYIYTINRLPSIVQDILN